MEQLITDFISKLYSNLYSHLIRECFTCCPSEIILTFAGLMSVKSGLSIPILFLISTIASFIGLLILYYLCRLINEESIYRFVDKHGKWFKLKGKDVGAQMTGLNVMVHGLYYVALSQYYVYHHNPAGINKMNVVTFAFIIIRYDDLELRPNLLGRMLVVVSMP